VKTSLEYEINYRQNRLLQLTEQSKRFFCNKRKVEKEYLETYLKLKDKQQELKELSK
jgi:hypothetical protein